MEEERERRDLKHPALLAVEDQGGITPIARKGQGGGGREGNSKAEGGNKESSQLWEAKNEDLQDGWSNQKHHHPSL